MRGLLVEDIIMAARAAMSVPPEAQDQLVADMLRDPHLADCARKRLGRGLAGRGERGADVSRNGATVGAFAGQMHRGIPRCDADRH